MKHILFPCIVFLYFIFLIFWAWCTSCLFCSLIFKKISNGKQKAEWDTLPVCIRNKLLKLDIHFLLFPASIKHNHAAMNGVLVRAAPLFSPCDGLSFGLGLPGTVCSTLTAWEVKPAWSLAFTRSSVSLPHLLHLFYRAFHIFVCPSPRPLLFFSFFFIFLLPKVMAASLYVFHVEKKWAYCCLCYNICLLQGRKYLHHDCQKCIFHIM